MKYTIQSGDTLSEIAQRNELTVEEIMGANPKISNPNLIYIGQELVIPSEVETDWYEGGLTTNDYQDNEEKEEAKLDSQCEECQEPKEKIKTKVVRISVFYDGTLNNRNNANQNGEGSYANDESNISILEGGLTDKSNLDEDYFGRNVYTEGIATLDNEEDDNYDGAAFGRGDRGVIAKAEDGIRGVLRQFYAHNIPKSNKITLYLDFFGFSRGAAAARYAIWLAMEYENWDVASILKSSGYTISKVTTQFVGLFDTVASYDPDAWVDSNYDNDTEELHLDCLAYATTVVQLAAAEEHRKNFRLTNINSASNGTQIFLPGAHSDIGGGYVDEEGEDQWEILDISGVDYFDSAKEEHAPRLQRERDWLIDAGWYTDDELVTDDYDIKIIATRPSIRSIYSGIPLHIMIDRSDLNFNDTLTSNLPFENDTLLVSVYNQIKQAITLGLCDTHWHWWNIRENDDFARLRHEHLHFSARYNTVYGVLEPNEPQFTNDDNESENATRQRIIQDG